MTALMALLLFLMLTGCLLVAGLALFSFSEATRTITINERAQRRTPKRTP
jgi:hypothetical protein